MHVPTSATDASGHAESGRKSGASGAPASGGPTSDASSATGPAHVQDATTAPQTIAHASHHQFRIAY